MKAAVFHGPNQELTIEQVEIDKPMAREVLVRAGWDDNGKGRWRSGDQPVDAELIVLNVQDVDRGEACVDGVVAERVGAHDGAGAD